MIPEHFFRRAFGELVARLSRRHGTVNLEAIEDAVQSAMLVAVERWKHTGVPEKPTAWLSRVANNQLLDVLRKNSTRKRHRARVEPSALALDPGPVFASELGDDLLRMLFVACDPSVPPESQLVFALKTLCGFSVAEVASRLFLSEANVYKRLSRARTKMRTSSLEVDDSGLEARLPAVHDVLYLLFTEGHLSSHADLAIRQELCGEAIRLTAALSSHPVGGTPTTHALQALMHLHAARLPGRQDGLGGLLLLEEQDRRRWDAAGIAEGLRWLARSAQGTVFSRFHAEARIAAAHCLAPSLEETPWEDIVRTYDLLERLSPSPLHRLGRAVAVAQWRGPAEGLRSLQALNPPPWLTDSYVWSAILADLHGRCGETQAAARHRARALKGAPPPVRALLHRRLTTGRLQTAPPRSRG